jgi:hypothetical protein
MLDQVVGGVGGKAGVEGCGGLCGQVLDHSLSRWQILKKCKILTLLFGIQNNFTKPKFKSFHLYNLSFSEQAI